MKKRRTLLKRIMSLTVRDYHKWNRAKTIVVILCMVIAFYSIGDVQNERIIDKPLLAFASMVCGFIVVSRIDFDWEPKNK
jgi:hypothetical protein